LAREHGTYLIHEFIERHADRSTVLDIRLMLLVVKLCLDCRWKDFDHLDLRLLQLFSQAEYELLHGPSANTPIKHSIIRVRVRVRVKYVKGCLASTVIGTA
jgi:hypothetical protein